MTGRNAENGFTLLEVLVASMLLGMLITILTMVFNSSSIAWSTGKAGVAEMDVVRNSLSAAAMVADNLVPGVEKDSPNEWGVLVSPWKSDGTLRESANDRRAVEKVANNQLANAIINNGVGGAKMNLPRLTRKDSWLYQSEQLWIDLNNLREMKPSGSRACIVGVWSRGPDGKENTGDDISTWPDVD